MARRLRPKPEPPPDRWTNLLSSLGTASCGVCGGNRASLITSECTVPLVRCLDCGHIYFSQRPTDAALADYYRSEDDGAYTENLRRWQADLKEQMTRLWISDATEFESRLPPSGSIPLRFLDIGCASGFQLLRAQAKGWSAFGIELSSAAVAKMRNEHKLDVFHGTVEQATKVLPPESFDLILMSHVLEHLAHPRTAVAAVKSLLKPQGVFCTFVPNGDGVESRLDFKKWEWSGFPDHLQFFTPRSLTRLLSDAGFVVDQQWTSVGHSDTAKLYAVLREALQLDSLEKAKDVAEALAPLCLLSDLRVIARKTTGKSSVTNPTQSAFITPSP